MNYSTPYERIAYRNGRSAYMNGKGLNANPFVGEDLLPEEVAENAAWAAGWKAGEAEGVILQPYSNAEYTQWAMGRIRHANYRKRRKG